MSVHKVGWQRSPFSKNKKWSKYHLTTDMCITLCGLRIPRMATTRIQVRSKTGGSACGTCRRIFFGD